MVTMVTVLPLLQDPLEVTVTRTCLDVLTELQESLANALELTPPVADETDAHFLIRNQLDQQVVVLTRGEYTVSGAARCIMGREKYARLTTSGRCPGVIALNRNCAIPYSRCEFISANPFLAPGSRSSLLVCCLSPIA